MMFPRLLNVSEVDTRDVIPLAWSVRSRALTQAAKIPDRDRATGLNKSSLAPLTPDCTGGPHDLTAATSPRADA